MKTAVLNQRKSLNQQAALLWSSSCPQGNKTTAAKLRECLQEELNDCFVGLTNQGSHLRLFRHKASYGRVRGIGHAQYQSPSTSTGAANHHKGRTSPAAPPPPHEAGLPHLRRGFSEVCSRQLALLRAVSGVRPSLGGKVKEHGICETRMTEFMTGLR